MKKRSKNVTINIDKLIGKIDIIVVVKENRERHV